MDLATAECSTTLECDIEEEMMEALEFLKERKRMCKSYPRCDGCPLREPNCNLTTDEDYTRAMRELAEADRDGRVVVLPCKVGDKLYRAFDGNISEHEVQNMKYFARQGRLGIDMTPFFPDAEKSIGKTVFLTREEAERALEGVTK